MSKNSDQRELEVTSTVTETYTREMAPNGKMLITKTRTTTSKQTYEENLNDVYTTPIPLECKTQNHTK